MRAYQDELTTKREAPPAGEVRALVSSSRRPVELAVSTKPAAAWPWPSAAPPPASRASAAAAAAARTVWLVAEEVKPPQVPAPESQPRAVDAGWARLADYDQAYGSWRQRWLSAPQQEQEVGAGEAATCTTAAGDAGGAGSMPVSRTAEKVGGAAAHGATCVAARAARARPARRTTETAPVPLEPRDDIEPTSTAAVAPPAAGVLTEGRRAQMRCQMVQTEGATLAESHRAHAAFMIQRALIRAAIRQRASRPQREADSGTPSRPPEQRPTDAGGPTDAGCPADAGASSSSPPVQPGGHP